MNKKPSGLLIFITLLVLCGQSLASPFLACHGDLSMSAEKEMEEHCRSMMTGASSTHAASDAADNSHAMHMASMAMDAPEDSMDYAGHADSHDCEYLCQFCRGAGYFDEFSPLALITPVSLPWPASSARSPIVLPPSEHFRPPTIA